MKIDNYEFPKSSFLSIQKDLDIITKKMIKNTRLQRLLYFTTPDALDRINDDIPEEVVYKLFQKNIKIVPKLDIEGSVLSYIIINFDNFTPNATNPEFRDNVISFDIICHFDQWKLKDFQLRPYMIAAEIDSMFNNKHLTGIGNLHFLGANQLLINDEFAGISLTYQAIHGEEDKTNFLNPRDTIKFVEEHHAMQGI